MSNTKIVAGVAFALTLGLMANTASAAAPTVFKSLDAAQGQLPESITTDDSGNIYLSMGTTVGKISPSGVLTTFATLPIDAASFVTGLKFGDDGHLYAGSAGFTPSPASAFVWRISPSGAHVEEYAELDPNGFPNDLAFDDDGNLYVTDPFLGQIWKIDECDQEPEVWLKSPLLDPNVNNPYLVISPFGVDGIAFDGGLDLHDVLHAGTASFLHADAQAVLRRGVFGGDEVFACFDECFESFPNPLVYPAGPFRLSCICNGRLNTRKGSRQRG